MTSVKLILNAYGGGSPSVKLNESIDASFVMLNLEKSKDDIISLNTYINIDDCYDFDPNVRHKVYVDEYDNVLIKCGADLLDTSFKINMLTDIGFTPDYKYDEYV